MQMDNGEPVGIAKQYNDKGQLIRVEEYDSGRRLRDLCRGVDECRNYKD